MADFAANLLSVPPVSAAAANGGTTAAALVTPPATLTGMLYGSGQDGVFIGGALALIFPDLFMGFVPAFEMAPDTVLSPRAVNRVYDSVAGKYVTWVTDGGDFAGGFYPGPGVYGVNTSNYVLVAYICSG